MKTGKEEARVAWMEEDRKFLADNGERYRKAKDAAPLEALVLVSRIMARLLKVGPDSQPYRAVWEVAQCQEILTPMSTKLDFIDKYETAKKRVTAYDQEKAREE
jgi:hypothetical protein